MDTVGKRLEWAREAAGLSSREVDRLAGITENHSRVIEVRVGNRAQLDTIERIAAALDVSAAWLAFGDGAEPDAEKLMALGARVRASRPSRKAAA